MKHSLVFVLLILLSLGLLVDCAPAKTPQPETTVGAPQSEATPQPESPTVTPQPEGVTVYYDGNSQFELVSAQGVRVLIDVSNPGSLNSPATDQDILLCSNQNHDYCSSKFYKAFQGQMLYAQPGEIKVTDVAAKSIASSRLPAEKIEPDKASNFIYMVNMSDLRFAFFGGIGQEQLTPEQLAELGEVDIAVTQFHNTATQMDMDNKKGFNLMEQVKPKLIIPTVYVKRDSVEYAVGQWEGFYSDKKSVTIDRSRLSGGKTKLLILGQLATSYAKIHKLTEW